jgi:hypothetical protein
MYMYYDRCIIPSLTWFESFLDFLFYSSSLLSRQLLEVSFLTIVARLFGAGGRGSSGSEAQASRPPRAAGGGDASRAFWSCWLFLLKQQVLLCVHTPYTLVTSWTLCHITNQSRQLARPSYTMFCVEIVMYRHPNSIIGAWFSLVPGPRPLHSLNFSKFS